MDFPAEEILRRLFFFVSAFCQIRIASCFLIKFIRRCLRYPKSEVIPMIKKNRSLSFRLAALAVPLLLICLFINSSQAFATDFMHVPDGCELEEILEKFETLVEKTRQEFGIPGMAVAIVQGDEVIYSKGFGVRKTGGDKPVSPDTVFQIGSTSKAFTAALVATLVDEKRVGWKDPVIEHLPDFAMADPWVTEAFQVRDLMAQHSGMKPYAGDILSLLGYGREYIVRSTAFIEPVSSFRSEFSYVNNLWLTAAKLIEAKTGKSWEQNLQERILDPLGMKNTTCSEEGWLRAPDIATLHIVQDGKVMSLDPDWPFFNWPYVYAPAGGINSTLLDMAKWVRFQLGDGTFKGKKILSSQNLEYPHCPQTIIDATDSYCMGWIKSDSNPYHLIWHNGETTGCKALVMMMPQVRLGIVILSNLGTRAQEALGKTFMDLYFGNSPEENYISRALEAWNRSKVNKKEGAEPAYLPEDCSEYEGMYESAFFGRGEIINKDKQLFLKVGPLGRRLILTPLKEDLFACEIEHLGLDEVSLSGSAKFEFSPDGEVDAFIITDADGDSIGRFERKPSDQGS